MVWVAVEMAASLRHTVWAALAGLTLLSACAGPAGASSGRPAAAPPLPSLTPTDLRDVVSANLTAAQQIRELNGLRTSLPHWRIVTPSEPDVLLAYYHEVQARYGIPWEYLAAINLIETSMGRI